MWKYSATEYFAKIQELEEAVSFVCCVWYFQKDFFHQLCFQSSCCYLILGCDVGFERRKRSEICLVQASLILSSFYLLCPDLWMETLESKYMFTVKAVTLTSDLWACSRGGNYELTQEMCLLSKVVSVTELVKLHLVVILEIRPQITLNASWAYIYTGKRTVYSITAWSKTDITKTIC